MESSCVALLLLNLATFRHPGAVVDLAVVEAHIREANARIRRAITGLRAAERAPADALPLEYVTAGLPLRNGQANPRRTA